MRPDAHFEVFHVAESDQFYSHFQLTLDYAENDDKDDDDDRLDLSSTKEDKATNRSLLPNLESHSERSECDTNYHIFEFTMENLKKMKKIVTIVRVEKSIVHFRSSVRFPFDHHDDEDGEDVFSYDVSFDFDSIDNRHEIDFLARTSYAFARSNTNSHSIDIHIYLRLYSCFENYPSPEKCDKSICEIFERPNVELLNDWLFCHNHSAGCDVPSKGKNANSFEIPDRFMQPIVLTRIEQVVCLLMDNDFGAKILLESIDDKDDSIYLEFVSSRKIFTANWHKSRTRSLSKIEIPPDSDNAGEHAYDFANSTSDNHRKWDINRLSFCETCLLRQQTFGSLCAEKSPPPPHLLRQYRMSFEVEWYRAERNLLLSLASRFAFTSSNSGGSLLNRMIRSADFFPDFVDEFVIETNRDDDDHNSDDRNSKQSPPFALLELYDFVRPPPPLVDVNENG